MSDAEPRHPVQRIEVRIAVGHHRMSGTDDPMFVGLRGPAGREFRLALAKGHAFRRGKESHFVLAGASGGDANLAHPELNDPTVPALDATAVTSCYLRKDSEPIPNVRGLGEMDDRIEIEDVAIQIYAPGLDEPRRFARKGPVWLGLVSGTLLEVPPVDGGS